MAGKFVLTAEVNLQSPKNLSKVAADINKALGKGASIKVDVPGASTTTAGLKKVETQTKKTARTAEQASGSFKKLGGALTEAVGHVARYDVARRIVIAFSNALRNAASEAVKFERELIKVSQVTGRSVDNLKFLTKEITRLSVSLGVSSSSLIKTTRILAQTGLTANDTKQALAALAKTQLAPTFDDITNTTESAIAAMAQFGIKASQLETLLSRINSVAGSFAVEAGDIGVAIRRAGGAFKSAGGDVQELIALFTSVRSTTRETAETIATGFRTIFTRLQRPTTIRFLKEFGINLQDLEGKFVGPFEAVRRLNIALKDLDPRDVRYSRIVEQLGGFRQVSKVIPLIQQFGKAQDALNVSQKGGASLSKDAITAQSALAVQMTRTKEAFTALIREISEDKSFRAMIELALKMAEAFINMVKAIKPLIPLLIALSAIKLGAGVASFIGGKRAAAGRGGAVPGIFGLAKGGLVPGKGNTDSVPAMLTPGEFVVTKRGVGSVGTGALHGINKYADGGKVGINANQFTSRTLQQKVVREKTGDLVKEANKRLTGDTLYNDKDYISLRSLDPIAVTYDNDKVTATGQNLGSVTARTEGNDTLKNAIETHNLAKRFDPIGSGQTFEDIIEAAGWMKASESGTAPFDGTAPGSRGGGVKIEVKSTVVPASNSEMVDKATREARQQETKIVEPLTAKGTDSIEIPYSVRLFQDALKMKGFAKGGSVSGSDTVPALLTPGEFVVNKKSAASYGYSNLGDINRYAGGGIVSGGKHRYAGAGAGGLAGQIRGIRGRVGAGGSQAASSMASMKLAETQIALEKQLRKNGASAQEIFKARDALLRSIKRDVLDKKEGLDISKALNRSKQTLTKVEKRAIIAEKRLNEARTKRAEEGEAGEEKKAGGVGGVTILLAISSLAALAQTFVKADSTMSTFLSTVTGVIATFTTMLLITQQLLASRVAEILLIGLTNKARAAEAAQSISIGLAVAAAGLYLYRSLTDAANAAAEKAMKDKEFGAELDKEIATLRGQAEEGGAIGGAVVGAGLGAAIGSIIPGIGTAIGLAIGAIVGGIAGAFLGAEFAIEKFEAKVRKLTFQKAQTNIENELQKVAEEEAELADVIAKVRANVDRQKQTGEVDAALTKRRIELQKKVLKEDLSKRLKRVSVPEEIIVNEFGALNGATKLLAAQQRISAKAVKDFTDEYGREIDEVAKLDGKSSAEARAAMRKLSDETVKAAFAQAKLAFVLREQASLQIRTRAVSAALKQMQQDVQNTGESLNNMVAGFGDLQGRFKGPRVGKFGEAVKRPEDVVDVKAFEREVKQSFGFLKEAAKAKPGSSQEKFFDELRDATIESRRAVQGLPDAVSRVSAASGIQKEGTAGRIIQELGLVTKPGEKDSRTVRLLKEVIDSALSGKGLQAAKESPTEFAKKVSKGLDEIVQVSIDTANLENEQNQQLAQMYAKRIDMENKLIEQQKRVMDLRDSNEAKMVKLRGRIRSVERLDARKQERARKLLGRQRVAGGAGPVEITGQALTIKNLSDRYDELNASIEKQQFLLETTDKGNRNRAKAVSEEIVQLNRVAAALNELADVAKAVAVLESDLAKAKDIRESKFDFLTKAVVGTPEEQRTQAKNLSNARKIAQATQEAFTPTEKGELRGGDPFAALNIRPSQKAGAVGVFDALAKAPLFQKLGEKERRVLGLDDLSDPSVKKKLEGQGAQFGPLGQITTDARATGQQQKQLAVLASLNATLQSQGKKPLTIEQMKQMVTISRSEEEILAEIEKRLQSPVEVALKREKQQKSDIERFSSVIETQNQRFLHELQRVLTLAEERRQQALVQKATTDRDVAQASVNTILQVRSFIQKSQKNVRIGEDKFGVKREGIISFTDKEGKRKQIDEREFAKGLKENLSTIIKVGKLEKQREKLRIFSERRSGRAPGDVRPGVMAVGGGFRGQGGGVNANMRRSERTTGKGIIEAMQERAKIQSEINREQKKLEPLEKKRAAFAKKEEAAIKKSTRPGTPERLRRNLEFLKAFGVLTKAVDKQANRVTQAKTKLDRLIKRQEKPVTIKGGRESLFGKGLDLLESPFGGVGGIVGTERGDTRRTTAEEESLFQNVTSGPVRRGALEVQRKSVQKNAEVFLGELLKDLGLDKGELKGTGIPGVKGVLGTGLKVTPTFSQKQREQLGKDPKAPVFGTGTGVTTIGATARQLDIINKQIAERLESLKGIVPDREIEGLQQKFNTLVKKQQRDLENARTGTAGKKQVELSLVDYIKLIRDINVQVGEKMKKTEGDLRKTGEDAGFGRGGFEGVPLKALQSLAKSLASEDMEQFRKDLRMLNIDDLDKGLMATTGSLVQFQKTLDALSGDLKQIRESRIKAEEKAKKLERDLAKKRGAAGSGPAAGTGITRTNPVTGEPFRIQEGTPLAAGGNVGRSAAATARGAVTQEQLNLVNRLAGETRLLASNFDEKKRLALGFGSGNPNVINKGTPEENEAAKAARREYLINQIALKSKIPVGRVESIVDRLGLATDFHTGGLVGGRGQVRANLLSGEFVTNRQATTQNPAALSAINAGVKLDEKFDEMIGKLNELNNTFNDAFSGTSGNALTVKPVAGSEGTQEVNVDTTVTHRDLNVRFVNAGVFADEAISEPIKKLMVAQVGEEIRKVADNLGILRDATSNTNRPIGQS